MRIGFVVNQVATEQPEYTTTRLTLAAVSRGHDVCVLGVDDFAHEPDGSVAARVRPATGRDFGSVEDYLDYLRDDDSVEQVRVDDLDVLFMRNDPADDLTDRPWAVTSGVLFGELAVARGVLVVNDPAGLADALNKTYFQHFPEEARPRTLITRDLEEIRSFVDELGGHAVLKPLQGSGGAGVFVVTGDESPNLNQIVETILRDGYVVAQERLPGAEEGDVRVFLMNGEPLRCDSAYAAFRRVNDTGDPRSNMHVGGRAEPVEMTAEMLALAEAARPKLLADGMFLVGLDIVGDKLMEVNVFSPGGLGSAQMLYDVDFAGVVVEDLERKIDIRAESDADIDNTALATR
jgi:glutathione synthase